MLAGDGAQPQDMPIGGAEVWKVMSQSPSQDVVLSCVNTPELACAAMARALEAHTGAAPARHDGPAQHQPGQITITLEMLREDKNILEGRLRWSEGGAPATTGPVLEVSVMDATVSPAAYDDLAKGLLKLSDLPL